MPSSMRRTGATVFECSIVCQSQSLWAAVGSGAILRGGGSDWKTAAGVARHRTRAVGAGNTEGDATDRVPRIPGERRGGRLNPAMHLRPASKRLGVPALGAVGGVASVALALLAFVDLGDPGAVARARLEREARSASDVARAELELARAASEPLAPASGQVLRWSKASELSVPLGLEREPAAAPPMDEVSRALLALARAAEREGRLQEARETLERAFPSPLDDAPSTAEARLLALRWARAAGDRSALERHLAALEALDWNVASGGTSLRLIGVLAAAPVLSADERGRHADAIAKALADGALAVGTPVDAVELTELGPRVRLDPELSALRALLDERLPREGESWSRLLGEPVRRARALSAAADDRAPVEGEWVLLEPGAEFGAGRVPVGKRLAIRLDAQGGGEIALHEERALGAALRARAQRRLAGSPWGAEPWGIELEQDITEPAESVAAIGDLFGLGAPLVVVHADPGAEVAFERRRFFAVRGALLLLAGLLGVATALGVRTARRARRLDELRRTFVASVSHDLRTPLASISNLAENLSDGVVVGEAAQREYHAAIRRETARLGRLVGGLLDFARIERGEAPRIRVVAVDAEDWLAELERGARSLADPLGVALRFERGALPSTLVLDPDAVHRAVMNLVENALRHSGAESVGLRVATDERTLAVDVIDGGQGVSPGLRETLFEPFEHRGESGGTGLGLAIVRSVAEAHGGTVRLLDGDGGRGLRAVFEVPLVRAEEESA